MSVASKNLKDIEMREVKPESIDGVDQSMWEDAPSVPGVGIAQVMCFKRNGLCKLYKNNIDYLLDVDPIFETFFDGMESSVNQERELNENELNVSVGDWVIVKYDGKMYPGEVKKVSVDAGECRCLSCTGRSSRTGNGLKKLMLSITGHLTLCAV